MHVFASAFYALIVFLAVLAYCAATGAPLLILLLLAPIIISGVIVALLALSLLIEAVRWAWRSRAAVLRACRF